MILEIINGTKLKLSSHTLTAVKYPVITITGKFTAKVRKYFCLKLFFIYLGVYFIRNMFSLFDSLLANNGAWFVTFQNNKKIEKVWFLRFYKTFNYFLQNRSYPDVEFYGWQNKRKNMFRPDKIARKAFCVGGVFYPLWKYFLAVSLFWPEFVELRFIIIF